MAIQPDTSFDDYLDPEEEEIAVAQAGLDLVNDPFADQQSLTAADFQDAFNQMAAHDTHQQEIPPIPESLNPDQYDAVTTTSGFLLVVAGPGSGKTRVLTERIANLVREGAAPESILAISFTRKAAGEVKERLGGIIGEQRASAAWVMTFHAFSSRLVRAEGGALGIRADFEMLDGTDQKRLLRQVAKEYNLKVPEAAISRISAAKRALMSSVKERIREMRKHDPALADLWLGYEKAKKKLNRLDYDDLIVYAQQLVSIDEIRQRWAAKFQHISVDEYQDTDPLQHDLVTRLAVDVDSFFIVGDPDQSVYSFRGSTMELMANFSHEFPHTKVVVLNDNYRSTQPILNTVRSIIEPIDMPFRSELRANTTGPCADVQVRTFFDSKAEVAATVSRIRQLIANGSDPTEIAVLYRTRAQSRLFERELRNSNIPFDLSGGSPFYERAVVKDTLAWVRLAVNPTDGMSFERVVKLTQGLGQKVRVEATDGADCHYDGDVIAWMRDTIDAKKALGKGGQVAVQAMEQLVSRIDHLRELLDVCEMSELISDAGRYVVNTIIDADERSAAGDTLRELGDDADQFRPENPVHLESGMPVTHPVHGDGIMQEYQDGAMVASILFEQEDSNGNPLEVEFLTDLLPTLVSMQDDRGITPIVEFLQTVSVDKQELADEEIPCVQLSTIHAAKGREFEHVMVVGINDGTLPIFPATEQRKNKDGSPYRVSPRVGVEEERRVMFVAASRAKLTLVLSWSRISTVNGSRQRNLPSEYLYELEQSGTARFDEPLPAAGGFERTRQTSGPMPW